MHRSSPTLAPGAKVKSCGKVGGVPFRRTTHWKASLPVEGARVSKARGCLSTSPLLDKRSGTELDALTLAHNYYRSILTHLAPYVGKRTVEVGAGIGTFSDILLKYTEASELTLVEPADDLFQVLKNRFPGETRAEVVHTHVEDLPGSLAADSVVLVNVLELRGTLSSHFSPPSLAPAIGVPKMWPTISMTSSILESAGVRRLLSPCHGDWRSIQVRSAHTRASKDRRGSSC